MRHQTSLIPLLSFALLLPLTGCGPQLNITNSERLDAMLPSPSDYPEGFDVEPIDMDEIDGTSVSAADFDSIEPADCERAMSNSPADFPDEAAEGAGQVAVHSRSSGPALYTYVLVSGDFEQEEFDASAYEAMLDSCSTMTVFTEDIEMEGGLHRADAPALPDQGGKFTMDLSADGMNMTMWSAWGQVEDVHFVLISMVMDTGTGPTIPTNLTDECEKGGYQCYMEQKELAADAARGEAEQEFDELLAVAVQKLEDSL